MAAQQGTGGQKKRKREKASMHPDNKYAENPPDFAFLASLYPSFKRFVSFTAHGKAKIDWTNFNATRELTRVLLLHDFGIQWWIPDGQLCPTVPNRANYIHWIQDLLRSHPPPWKSTAGDSTWGFDIGTGANCIYPLLGAAIHGWHFIGTDVTDTALEWSQWNIQQNPHLAGLISIRSVRDAKYQPEVSVVDDRKDGTCNILSDCFEQVNEVPSLATATVEATDPNVLPISNCCSPEREVEKEEVLVMQQSQANGTVEDCNFVSVEPKNLEDVCIGHENLPVLAGVVHDTENFDFCMCNPPFFESMKEAGMNPHTSCGGTSAEMVYPGGEEGFIMKIIEDSMQLKEQIHWFTTMVGRKVNLKLLTSELRQRGVRIIRTTEFVQGRTCRWGLAWSYNSPKEGFHSQQATPTNSSSSSFMIEGLPRHCKAFDVLQAMALHIQEFGGAVCKVDTAAFILKGSFSDTQEEQQITVSENNIIAPSNVIEPLHFTISVFEQAPGTLLIKGKLLEGKSGLLGRFSSMLSLIEQKLKQSYQQNKL